MFNKVDIMYAIEVKPGVFIDERSENLCFHHTKLMPRALYFSYESTAREVIKMLPIEDRLTAKVVRIKLEISEC